RVVDLVAGELDGPVVGCRDVGDVVGHAAGGVAGPDVGARTHHVEPELHVRRRDGLAVAPGAVVERDGHGAAVVGEGDLVGEIGVGDAPHLALGAVVGDQRLPQRPD